MVAGSRSRLKWGTWTAADDVVWSRLWQTRVVRVAWGKYGRIGMNLGIVFVRSSMYGIRCQLLILIYSLSN